MSKQAGDGRGCRPPLNLEQAVASDLGVGRNDLRRGWLAIEMVGGGKWMLCALGAEYIYTC